jgi:hypothetical protein
VTSGNLVEFQTNRLMKIQQHMQIDRNIRHFLFPLSVFAFHLPSTSFFLSLLFSLTHTLSLIFVIFCYCYHMHTYSFFILTYLHFHCFSSFFSLPPYLFSFISLFHSLFCTFLSLFIYFLVTFQNTKFLLSFRIFFSLIIFISLFISQTFLDFLFPYYLNF